MKTVAALFLTAVALMLPSSLFAAPIEIEYGTLTFETTLSMDNIHVEFPPFRSEFQNVHYIPTYTDMYLPNVAVWDVPDFDDTLGTPVALLLTWWAFGPGSHLTVISDDPVPPPLMFFVASYSDGIRQGPEGAYGQVYIRLTRRCPSPGRFGFTRTRIRTTTPATPRRSTSCSPAPPQRRTTTPPLPSLNLPRCCCSAAG
jgi:hypothetical protein